MKSCEMDWGDVRCETEQRASFEARLPLVGNEIVRVSLRRRGVGHEARVRLGPAPDATQVRLQGDDLGVLLERVRELLEVIVHERESARL